MNVQKVRLIAVITVTARGFMITATSVKRILEKKEK